LRPVPFAAPTPYSIRTGTYPWRGRAPGGTWGLHGPAQFLSGQKTVANLLQEAGYRTAMFGQSGIGGLHAAPDFTQPMIDGPKRWGFDYSFIIPRGHFGLILPPGGANLCPLPGQVAQAVAPEAARAGREGSGRAGTGTPEEAPRSGA